MRILVATVTAGGGHLQAAAALEEAWKTTCPSDDVKRVDLLDLVPKVQRQLYADAYIKLGGTVLRCGYPQPLWRRSI